MQYTKRDVLIPMRDGVRLYTVIFTPKDLSRSYPILFNRTPYSVPYGPDDFPGTLGPSEKFDESGYIFVHQDVRGQFMSEGVFENMRPELKAPKGSKEIDESTDAYDTIEWLLKNVPANNGRVGMWGISYPGFYAACGMIRAHPALKAVSPQAPIADWFLGDDDHHNGAFLLMDNFDWDFSMGFDTPRGAPTQHQFHPLGRYPAQNAYRFYLDLGPLKNGNARYFHGRVPFWNDLIEHDVYDRYWRTHGLLPHVRDVRPAVLIVGGWFDAEDYWGTLHIHRTLRKESPRTDLRIVLGPWPHGGWAGGDGDSYGDVEFGSKTAAVYRDQIEFPFFEHYLKDARPLDLPRARVFDTGAKRWLSFDAWPPSHLTRRNLYFQAGGALSFTPPKESKEKGTKETGTKEAADAYVSDPADPVPYSASASSQIERRSEYMIEDQRFVSGRKDVLTYCTEPLSRDIAVMGPMRANLFTAITGTDADFVVKLIDVFPDAPKETEGKLGSAYAKPSLPQVAQFPSPAARRSPSGGFQMLVRAEVMRGKFRNSYERPEPFQPGRITPVRFELPDVCHTFRKGHRLMVQVQSSWFPLVDRNPQQFLKINQADAADFRKETIKIYRSSHAASYLEIGVP